MLDPQMRQRAPDLRRLAAIHLAAGFSRVKVMTAAIGIKAQRQAATPEYFQQGPERRNRAFFLDQKRRVNLARRVVHRHHQIKRRSVGQPRVPRGVPRIKSGGRLWCNIMPGNGRRGRLRRCAPRCSAFGNGFRLCRNAFVQL
jgi:hypothetical protein